MTHSQQSTVNPIFRPVSPQSVKYCNENRPVIDTASNFFPPPHAPHHIPTIHRPPPQSRMQFPNRSDLAMRSDTNKQGAQGELHAKLLSGTTVPGTPHRPPYLKSHVVPPRPHPPTAQKPRNINDPISKPETSSRELRAKLLSCTRFLGCPPGGRRGAYRAIRMWLRRPWGRQGQGTHAHARLEAAAWPAGQ